MNILFVSSTDVGGSGLSQRQLAHRLIERGHRVEILCEPASGDRLKRYVYRRAVNLTTKLRESRVRGPLLVPQRWIGLRPVPADYDVPVFYTPVPENGLRWMCRNRFVPDVVVGNSILRVSWRRLLPQIANLGALSVLYLREESAVTHLTVSGAVPDVLVANAASHAEAARAAGHDCEVVPSVIETDAALVDSTREEVLLINPIESHGGDRVRDLAAARPDIPIALQESWPLTDEQLALINDLLAEHPNIVLRRHTTDLSRVYRQARLLLVPHRVDNRPRVVAEAQANGIPVIATDHPGLREAVGGGGVILPRPYAAQDLVAAVVGLWDDSERYAGLIEAARRHASSPDIDPALVTDRFERLVESARSDTLRHL